MTKKAKYCEGEIFCIPVREGGHGLVLVVRKERSSRHGNSIVCLFCFDKLYNEPPSSTAIENLQIADVCAVLFSMDLCLVDGSWTSLGRLPHFDREVWFVPPQAVFQEATPWNPRSGWSIDVTEDEELRGVRLEADRFASPEECKLMPRCDGLRSSDGAEIVANEAIRHHNPRYRFTATSDSVRIWRACIDRVKAAGVYPAAEPR